MITGISYNAQLLRNRLECSREFGTTYTPCLLLDEEQILNKKLISETIFIKQQINRLLNNNLID